MSDFEVLPVGTGKVLQRALRELEAGFGGGQVEPDAPERHCGGPGCDGTCCQPAAHQPPAAWRFRTINAPGVVWRLTDDADLIERMRALGHWEIRPLVELDTAPTDTSKEPA